MIGWKERNQQAMMRAREGDLDGARQLWSEALEELLRVGGQPEFVILVMDNIARIDIKQGNYESAELQYRHLIETAIQAYGERSPSLAKGYSDLAELLETQGQFEEAEKLLRQSLSIWESTLGWKHVEVGQCLRAIGRTLKEQGKYADAELMFRKALDHVERTHGRTHADVARILNDIAYVTLMMERFEEAEELFRRLFDIWKFATASKRPDVARSLNDLAHYFHMRGNQPKAEKMAGKALSLSVKALGPANIEAARAHNLLGIICGARDEFDEASEHFQQAVHIMQVAYGAEDRRVKEIWQNLTMLEQKRARERPRTTRSGEFAKPAESDLGPV